MTPDPQPGDVESVTYADRDKARAAEAALAAGLVPLLQAPVPAPNEQVAIRLVGHPVTYVVRVTTKLSSGPTITELTVKADDGHAVDYKAVRAIPVRRLAYSAAGWINRAGGTVAFPGDYSETHTRPEQADPRLSELAWRIESAIMAGEPVRPTVARKMHVSTSTLDRMMAKARAEGLLEGIELPRRPSPQQRDALRARYLIEEWLSEHGPDAEPPPELAAELRRLSGDEQDTPATTTEDDR